MLQGDEDIVMRNDVNCNLLNHHPIYALCISGKCRNNATTLCQQCFLEDDHSNRTCQNNLKNLNDIRNLLLELLKLQKEYKSLQERINLIFDGVYSEIQKLLTPIYDYQKEPNLTNLNNIGLLLRTFPKRKISGQISQSKTQIRMLLENEKYLDRQNNQQEDYNQDENKWFDKGQSLCEDQKYQDALEYFNKQIQINPRHESSWHFKGIILTVLEKYQEAKECYEKLLQINPGNDSGKFGLEEVIRKLQTI